MNQLEIKISNNHRLVPKWFKIVPCQTKNEMDPITNIARQCHLKLGGRHVGRLAVQGSHTVRNSLVPKGKKTSAEYGCREGGQASG